MYQMMLVFEEPIEFAPIHTDGSNLFETNLNVYQYRHAVRFQRDIHPALGLFRVCRQIHEEARPLYYSINSFRFSNVFGWVSLDRFLTLIGPSNRKLLRHITVVHPGLTIHLDTHKIAHMNLRYLNPFRMMNIPPNVYPNSPPLITSLNGSQQCVDRAVGMLRSIPALRQLSFLLHGLVPYEDGMIYHPTWRCFSEWDGYFDVREHRPDNHELWKDQKLLDVDITFLVPGSSFDSFFDVGYVKTVDISGVTNLGLVEAVETLRTVFATARDLGWEVKEMRYGEWCAHYPLQEGQEADHGQSDESCERCTWYAEYLPTVDHPRCQSGGMWQGGCVWCWKPGKEDCICEDGGDFSPEIWWRDLENWHDAAGEDDEDNKLGPTPRGPYEWYRFGNHLALVSQSKPGGFENRRGRGGRWLGGVPAY